MKRDIIYIDRAPVGRFPNSTANQKCHWGDSTCLKFTLFLISEKVSWFLWLKLTTATSIIVSKENFLLRGSLGPCTLIHMNLHMWQQDLPKYQVLFFYFILLQCKLLSNCILNPESKELTYFMLKSCFTPVLVLMGFNLMFMHFSSLWEANDLFSMKIMNQPIRADFATIGWKSSI